MSDNHPQQQSEPQPGRSSPPLPEVASTRSRRNDPVGASGYMEFCQPHWDEFTVTHLSRRRNLGFPIVIDMAETTGHEHFSSFMGRLVTAPLELDSELLMVLSGPEYRSTSAYWALFRAYSTDIGKQQWAGRQARLCGRLQLGAGWQPLQGLEATL